MNSARSDSKRIAISGELNIYRAQELKSTLLSPLEFNADTEIDLSGVTEMDGAGLQLLVLTKLEASRRQVAIHYVAHSPAVVEVIELCNMAPFFGDPILLQTP